MDRRNFRRVEENTLASNNDNSLHYAKEKFAKAVVVDEKRLAALRELGNHLQVKAEKMRLLARAGEGLDEGEFNPFATTTIPARPQDMPEKVEEAVISLALDGHMQVSDMQASKARDRRRLKKSKHKGHGGTTVDIKQYRPGYTWNKGGRVKELRIRTLARKFLTLWKRNVFGRITPSEARSHYHRRLLKKTFGVWKDIWWELRKEWRLFIRAECHHRYVLWRKTFQAWREYIDTQRIMNSKIAVAEQYASGKCLRRCWNGWEMYLLCRRRKRERQEMVVYHRQYRLLKCCWEKWAEQHELVLHRRHLEAVGLQFWAYRVQAQYWLVWQARLQQRRAMVMNQFRAVRHHSRRIVSRCFQAWLVYWARRRQKLQEKEYAVLLYQRGLVSRMFQRWQDSYRFRQDVLEREERIQNLADRFQARRALVHWKHYICLKNEAYENEAMAEEHYMRRLMTTGLSAFRLCVVQRKIKLMRQEMADQLRYQQLLRWGWNCWLARCDNNEELRLIGLSQLARKHYRVTVLRKCLMQLQQYCIWRQHRREQYARADAYFYMRAMPEYLFRWKVFVQLVKTKRENMENMVEFRRENLLARYFYMWVNQFEFSKENRMNERIAILHADSCMLKSFFRKWKERTVESQEDAEKQVIATQHYHEVLCQRHLRLWISYIHDLKLRQQQEVMAATHHYSRNLRVCFQTWRKYESQRREKKQKTYRAQQHYGHVICRKMLAMWLHYVDTQRCIAQRAEVMYRRKCAQLVCRSFHTWRQNVFMQIQERDSEARAVWHYTHCVLTKVFKVWQRFAAIHAYKKSETRKWVESAREHISLKVQQIYFTKWLQHHEQHVDMRLKYERAVCHHSYRVKLKVMHQWKLFTQESIRKTLLQKQCDWFLNLRLTAHCFTTWKHSLAVAEEEKQKTNLALWHWCLTLHRKVLIRWYTYTQQRKHKKARYAQAMENRRLRLLQQGATQWLLVADQMSAMRKNFAIQQQAKTVYDRYQLVLRCGLHWKHWTMRRRKGKTNPRQRATSQSGVCPAPTPLAGMSSALTTPREPCISHRLGSDVLTITTPRSTEGASAVTPGETVPPTVEREFPAPVVAVSPGRSMFPTPAMSTVDVGIRPQLKARPRPRQPSFLMESLKRAGLFMGAPSLESMETQAHSIPVTPLTEGAQTHNPILSVDNSVERLNLSNLSSSRTAADVESGKCTGGREYTSLPQSGRSDQRRELSLVNQDLNEPFSRYRDNQQPVGAICTASASDKLHPTPHAGDILSIPVIDKTFETQFVPKVTEKVKLMTPADFMQKAPAKVDQTVAEMTPRFRSVHDNSAYSEGLSVASTPRVLCQSAHHNHPLSETHSFRVGEFPGDITPRSTSSGVTSKVPSNEMSSLGFEMPSVQSVQKEIVTIRNRLKSFDQKKRKLRTMQKQLKQLSDWLTEMKTKGQNGSDDEDVASARQEVLELSADVAALKTVVEEEKGHCAGLVERVKVLAATLTAEGR